MLFVHFLTVLTQKYILVKSNMSDLIMYYVFYVFIHYVLRFLGAFIIDVDFFPFFTAVFALIYVIVCIFAH